MAFGKPTTEVKKLRNVVGEDILWRTAINSEENSGKNWQERWSWILDEYQQLHAELKEVSKGSAFLSEVNKILKEEDKRTIRPIPRSTNHQYGWLASKPDFNMERYGPDYDRGLPLPPMYYLIK